LLFSILLAGRNRAGDISFSDLFERWINRSIKFVSLLEFSRGAFTGFEYRRDVYELSAGVVYRWPQARADSGKNRGAIRGTFFRRKHRHRLCINVGLYLTPKR
jgi:hypothetical protein